MKDTISSMTIDQAKKLVCKSGKRLLEEGYVSGTWGNISSRIDGEFMAITPSGREYETMEDQEIVIVNFHDHTYAGDINPSSEFRLHTEIYRTRGEVNAVIHTHQMNASTVAAARREIPPILDDMAQIIGPTVRCAKYAMPNTTEIVDETVQALKDRNAALMANHGAVCVGRDMKEAFVVCQILEKACKAFIDAEAIGGAASIDMEEAWEMHRFYMENYSKQKK